MGIFAETLAMRLTRAKLALVGLLLSWSMGAFASSPLLEQPGLWVIEQQQPGSATFRNGMLEIRDKNGCTVWFRRPLMAPVRIRFTATLRSTGRVSDLNCFWMATDPRCPEDLFHPRHERTGAFSTYDSLRTYYVGYGGNNNTTTRFRRYDGTGARPLLPEHDLKGENVLLKPEQPYHIEITVAQGVTRYARNGEVLFTFRDAQPLETGWFGFRTVDSHIDVTAFEISTDFDSSVTGR
jgi:hypothetical protein